MTDCPQMFEQTHNSALGKRTASVQALKKEGTADRTMENLLVWDRHCRSLL